MKRSPIIWFVLMLFCSCNNSSNDNSQLQKRIDSLSAALNKSYKPGFGEFMSSIQIHHEKLWFAGINENWKLAEFEIGEIKENIEGIEAYCTNRSETKSIPMIKPVLDSISQSIAQNNSQTFKSNFILLTNTCNSCHKAVDFGFNVIKVPESPPFSNQVFKHE